MKLLEISKHGARGFWQVCECGSQVKPVAQALSSIHGSSAMHSPTLLFGSHRDSQELSKQIPLQHSLLLMHESLFAKHPEYAVVEDNNSHFPIKLHFSASTNLFA